MTADQVISVLGLIHMGFIEYKASGDIGSIKCIARLDIGIVNIDRSLGKTVEGHVPITQK